MTVEIHIFKFLPHAMHAVSAFAESLELHPRAKVVGGCCTHDAPAVGTLTDIVLALTHGVEGLEAFDGGEVEAEGGIVLVETCQTEVALMACARLRLIVKVKP